MGEYKFDSAGVSAQEVGTLGPTPVVPTGRSACVIATAKKGPAFVPLTLGSFQNFIRRYGDIDGTLFGPLAARAWIANANSITYMRVLGAGDGNKRDPDGYVTSAGFTVGEEQPSDSADGLIASNSFANFGGPLGRTYFLGCFMSESFGETIFSSAGLQGTGSQNGIVAASVPILRGILMAPSGVILKLSSSGGTADSSTPPSSYIAQESTAYGTSLGSVTLFSNNNVQQEFVLLLNGYNSGTNPVTALTASMDMQSSKYFASVFNTDPTLIQEKGHYLYAHWDIHPTSALLTGVGVVAAGADVPSDADRTFGTERSIFLLTSSLMRNTGSSVVPNYEGFRDRFLHARSPWFISQKFHGKPVNLFRLHALDDGSDFAKNYKITIKNIVPQPPESSSVYGSFDILIRNINDPDTEASIPLESHVNMNLDPSSDRYISKVIGDLNVYFDFDRSKSEQKIVYEGSYALNSSYVRVEVSKDVEDKLCPPEALPLGFRGIYHVVTSGSAPLAPLNSSDSAALIAADYLQNTVQPPLPLRLNNKTNSPIEAPSTNKSWGTIFDHVEQNNNIIKNPNSSFQFFTKYFPHNCVGNLNFFVGDNEGAQDTASNGILDADRFCYNQFSLENIKITTGSNGTVDPSYEWNLAEYVRNGEIQVDDIAKTRRISLKDFLTSSNSGYLRYDVPFQGGFDGVNIFDQEESSLTSVAATSDMLDANRGRLKGPTVSAYRKAIEIAGDPTVVDFSVLAIPGIREPAVTDFAIDTIEQRFDSIYIMDLEQAATAQEAVKNTKLRGLNSSFVAAYFPDAVMKVFQTGSLEVTVPPSVAVLGAISLNDSIGQPWFAPAGVTRGILNGIVKTAIPISEPDVNLLYSNNINPLYATTNIKGIDNFENISGIVLWGQKTMKRTASAIDRINVRRLMIEVRRAVKEIALQLLFEPGRLEVIARFNAAVAERVGTIQALGGMDDYKIAIDSNTTTQQDIENNTIRGKVYIKPKKTDEFVTLDFLVSNSGGEI